jgi:hypothetical protein
VYSGADWRPLCTITGEAPGDGFGSAVAGVGDADKDGHPDFVIGSGSNDAGGGDAGRAYLYTTSFYCPPPPCFDRKADVNCDKVEDIFDVIYLIDYVFSGGPPRVLCPQE